MTKIVHLCLSAFYIDNYSYQENMLTKYHIKLGYDVTIIASLFTFNSKGESCYLPSPSTYYNKDGCKVIRIDYKHPLQKINRILGHFEGLAKLLEEEKPDLIFSHNLSYRDIIIVKKYLLKNRHVKLFADNHADYVNSAKNFLSRHILHPIIWRYYAKQIEPFLTKCYGVTPLRCQFLKEMYHINPSIIEFLPMGVDDESIPQNRISTRNNIRNQYGIKEDDFVIFTGGKIDIKKNIHLLLDTLDKIKCDTIHLIICGVLTPQMEYILPKIKKNSNIHYIGWCDADTVMKCMVASDLAVFPGTHSTLWEQSIGMGLPAIFKHWHAMEHVLVYNNCLLLDNVKEQLTPTIQSLINTPLFFTLRNNAKKVAPNFCYSNIAKRAINYE